MNAESNVVHFPDRARDSARETAEAERLFETMLYAASKVAEEIRAAEQILAELKADLT